MASLIINTPNIISGNVLSFIWSGFLPLHSIDISVIGGGGVTLESDFQGKGQSSFVVGETPSSTPYTLQASDGTNIVTNTFTIVPAVSSYFIINGQTGTPGIVPGTTINAVLWVINNDRVSHDIGVNATEANSFIALKDADMGQLGAGQSMQIAMAPFIMPNQNDTINYYVFVDGNYANGHGEEFWSITALSQTGPFTSVSGAVLPASAKANTNVSFSAVVRNESSSTITVQMKGVINPNTDNVTVTVSPASFTLAPGATKTVSGSFTMRNEDCYLDIQSYVNNILDTFYEGVVSLTMGTPTLTVNNTQIGANGTMSFSGSGFYPNTAITINVVNNNGSTNVAMAATDASGNFNGTTPALNFPAGSYTLQASDVYGDSATAGFSIIAPATVSITITPSGSGTVSYSPSTNLKSGMIITLTPTAKAGYYFSYWQLPDGTTQATSPGTCALHGGVNNVTAVFSVTDIPPDKLATITTPISPAGAGTVIVSPNAPYQAGDLVTVTAIPADNYYFAYWKGDTTQTTNPIMVTLVAGANPISAKFVTTLPPVPGTNNNVILYVGLGIAALVAILLLRPQSQK